LPASACFCGTSVIDPQVPIATGTPSAGIAVFSDAVGFTLVASSGAFGATTGGVSVKPKRFLKEVHNPAPQDLLSPSFGGITLFRVGCCAPSPAMAFFSASGIARTFCFGTGLPTPCTTASPGTLPANVAAEVTPIQKHTVVDVPNSTNIEYFFIVFVFLFITLYSYANTKKRKKQYFIILFLLMFYFLRKPHISPYFALAFFAPQKT
jgi:hypothetical protein